MPTLPTVVSADVSASQTAVAIALDVGTAEVTLAFIVAVRSPDVGALVRFVTVGMTAPVWVAAANVTVGVAAVAAGAAAAGGARLPRAGAGQM